MKSEGRGECRKDYIVSQVRILPAGQPVVAQRVEQKALKGVVFPNLVAVNQVQVLKQQSGSTYMKQRWRMPVGLHG